MHGQRFKRALCAALIVFAASAFPVVADAAPGDQPAVDQYADPFGPLPTRERPASLDPLSGDLGTPSPRLLRELAQVDESDRGPLATLVTQVNAAMRRVRETAVPVAATASPPAEHDSNVLDAPAASFFDLGGPGPWIIAAAAALAAVAAVRARAIHTR